MTDQEFKRYYQKDTNGHRVWSGPVKVWYKGRMWYPHLLIRRLLNQIEAPSGWYWKRKCDREGCISPEHYELVRKQQPIEVHQWGNGNNKSR